jgi:peptidoglycan/LPS O-acetylase OafA/YrhL
MFWGERGVELNPDSGAAPSNPAARVEYLDGLRGWASLSVAFAHIVSMPLYGDVLGLRIFPIALFANGSFMVVLFFVLSGDALSTQYWRRPGVKSVFRQLVKRYPRLTVPVVAACLLTLTVITLFGSYAAAGGVATGNANLSNLEGTHPGFGAMLVYAFTWVYIQPFHVVVIPFLWSMKSEMLGSIGLFGCLFFAHVYPRWNVLALALLTIVSLAVGLILSCFFFGALISLLRFQGRLPVPGRGLAGTLAGIGAVGCLVTATYLSFNHLYVRQVEFSLAFALYALLPCSAALISFTTSRLALVLGRISFPLYLTHYVVMAAFSCRLLVQLAEHKALTLPATLGVTALGMVVALIVATLFLPVERGATALANFVWRVVAGILWRQPAVVVETAPANPAG